MKRATAVLMASLVLVSCGSTSANHSWPSVRPTASTSTPATSTPVVPTPSATAPPTAAPTGQPTPISTPPSLQPGSYAYVAVSVATGWRSPSAVRAVDGPALTNPVRLTDWLIAMNWSQKADLIGRADTQALLGDRVLVLAMSSGWVQVVIPNQGTPLDARGYPVWIPTAQLSPVPAPTTPTLATVTVPTTRLQTSNGGPTLDVSYGTRLPVTRNYGTSLQVGLPGGATATIQAAAVTLTPSGTLPSTAASLLASARQFLGLPYLWAGTSAFGYDCSGLVYLVYRVHSVLLPRDADAQSAAGRWVAKPSLQPGDLVFFGTSSSTIHHVAIYAGEGNILESPQTGYPVRLVPLSSYSDYFTARRVLP